MNLFPNIFEYFRVTFVPLLQRLSALFQDRTVVKKDLISDDASLFRGNSPRRVACEINLYYRESNLAPFFFNVRESQLKAQSVTLE